MGTTLYGSSSQALPSGLTTPTTVQASWSFTSAAIQRKGAVTGSDSSSATTWGPDTARSGGPYTSCLGQWAYGPLAAQTFGGTLACTLYGESGTFVNFFISAMAAWIAKPDGTLRANLLAAVGDPNAVNWVTTLQQYSISAQNLTANSSNSGDFLILEAGDDANMNFVSADAGTLGVGNSRIVFTFSQSVQTASAVANGVAIPWGRPQPRR